MAELTPKTVGELPEASSLSNGDLFAISSGSASKKTLWSTIKAAFASAFFPLSIANGGTGATTADAAMTALGNADYVVEQGTSGGWAYRKWNSGVAECWRYSQYTGIQLNTLWTAPIYYHDGVLKETLPSGLFYSVTSCQYSVDPASGVSGADCWAGTASGNPLTTSSTCGIYLLRVNSASGAKVVNIYWSVQGRWKA